jgi:hypothetical protein
MDNHYVYNSVRVKIEYQELMWLVKLDRNRIEDLARNYQRGDTSEKNDILTEMLDIYKEVIMTTSSRASKDSGGIDTWLFESAMYDKVWKSLEIWKSDGTATFYTYLITAHKMAIIDVIRKQRKDRYDHRKEVYVQDIISDSANDEAMFGQDDLENDVGSIQVSCNIDNKDFDRVLIENDQRQLVDEFVRGSGKNAPKVIPIVNVYLADCDSSLESIGDAIGESKQVIDYRLTVMLRKILVRVLGENNRTITDYYVA